MRAFFEGDSTTVPSFYVDRIRSDLRGYWDALPANALYHDQNAYLRSTGTPMPLARSSPATQAGAA